MCFGERVKIRNGGKWACIYPTLSSIGTYNSAVGCAVGAGVGVMAGGLVAVGSVMGVGDGVGAGVLVAHIVLIIWASLFAFKRTQIKS